MLGCRSLKKRGKLRRDLITGRKTIAFDLDGTLCTNTNGDYELAKPYTERIARVNNLHSQGIKIIIFSARGATSGRDLRHLTLTQLASWGVNFDELILEKPHFDLLVDDKAVSETDYFGETTCTSSRNGHLTGDLALESTNLGRQGQ